jgi:hypothetical protein
MTPLEGLAAYTLATEQPPGILTCGDTIGLVPVSAIDDTEVWREVVRLVALPYGWEVDAQRCTNESLRAHEKHQKQLSRLEKEQADASLPGWSGAMDVAGIRVIRSTSRCRLGLARSTVV